MSVETARGERILEARGLKKRFAGVAAVDGVSLSVARGECLALLGPNGAGKTTTVEMLEGLLVPDEGDILLFGRPLASARREIMERLGVVLQETNLYKRYTVEETLRLFASFFRKSLSPEQVMARLSLLEKRGAQLRHLSGGQKQRVGLGCALINDPELLFLDEPTTGLDPQTRRNLWSLIAELKAEGKGVLLTTHYMEEAEVLADRVAIIDQGRIIAQGSPRQLIREVLGEQVLCVALADEGAGVGPERVLERLPWLASARRTENGYEVAADDGMRRLLELAAVVSELGVGVRRLEVRRGTLEDVFLKLTGRVMRDD